MKLILLTIGAFLLLGACAVEDETELSNPIGETEVQEDDTNSTTNNGTTAGDSTDSTTPKFSHRIVLTENEDWGYQIFEGAKMLIDQKHIPSVQGNSGFKTKEKAEKTALYIIYKLENNMFPPSINKHELDSLGVLSE